MTSSPETLRADEGALVALMIAYQAGDLAAFEQLYALLVDDVRRYFARIHREHGVAGDLAQDVFLELHRARRTYTPPLPVRPWVFGIARNVAARSRRAARARPPAHAALDAERDAVAASPPPATALRPCGAPARERREGDGAGGRCHGARARDRPLAVELRGLGARARRPGPQRWRHRRARRHPAPGGVGTGAHARLHGMELGRGGSRSAVSRRLLRVHGAQRRRPAD